MMVSLETLNLEIYTNYEVSVRSAGPLEMTMLQVMHGGVYHRYRCLREVDFVLCRKFDSFTLLLLAFEFVS
jgi:hypothetical protein